MGEHSAGTIPERADREKNKEKMRERRRLRLQSDPAFRERECARDREWKRRKRYEQVYGISLADYDAMLERQSDAYAICKKSDEALCVDHCHGCNEVRGLLCAKCNSALGFCNDSPEHLWRRPLPAGCTRDAGEFYDIGWVGRNRPVAGERDGSGRDRRCPSLSLRRQSRMSPG
jgi:hypothetical protein